MTEKQTNIKRQMFTQTRRQTDKRMKNEEQEKVSYEFTYYRESSFPLSTLWMFPFIFAILLRQKVVTSPKFCLDAF